MTERISHVETQPLNYAPRVCPHCRADVPSLEALSTGHRRGRTRGIDASGSATGWSGAICVDCKMAWPCASVRNAARRRHIERLRKLTRSLLEARP